MKTLHWSLRTLLFVCLVQIISCTKTSDADSLSIQTSNDLTFPTTNEFGTCKLRRIYHDYGGISVSGVFTYNSAGNPISLVYNNNGTGNPNHYFTYDKQGRLRNYSLTHNNGTSVVVRHAYGYDSNNRIATDTAFHDEGGVPIVFVSTFTYDNLGRIVKENIRNIANASGGLYPTRNPTYTYDNRGNVAVAGWKSSSYDNKVSIFRSNAVFQFIHRNYSKNNAAPQAKYNSKGLPLSANPVNDEFFNAARSSAPGSPGGVTLAIYDCQ